MSPCPTVTAVPEEMVVGACPVVASGVAATFVVIRFLISFIRSDLKATGSKKVIAGGDGCAGSGPVEGELDGTFTAE